MQCGAEFTVFASAPLAFNSPETSWLDNYVKEWTSLPIKLSRLKMAFRRKGWKSFLFFLLFFESSLMSPQRPDRLSD